MTHGYNTDADDRADDNEDNGDGDGDGDLFDYDM